MQYIFVRDLDKEFDSEGVYVYKVFKRLCFGKHGLVFGLALAFSLVRATTRLNQHRKSRLFVRPPFKLNSEWIICVLFTTQLIAESVN